MTPVTQLDPDAIAFREEQNSSLTSGKDFPDVFNQTRWKAIAFREVPSRSLFLATDRTGDRLLEKLQTADSPRWTTRPLATRANSL